MLLGFGDVGVKFIIIMIIYQSGEGEGGIYLGMRVVEIERHLVRTVMALLAI